MSSNLTLSRGLRMALSTAATASVAHTPAVAADEPAAKDTTLEEVVVTGSRIRRVDLETASPVFVIDQAAIQQSGLTTVSELVQRIPSVSGAATNGQVNNGGGYGEATIELRGLDAKRTLVLLDGRRLGLVGYTADATDINQIPINLIERVEVLKEGAGAIYGSDAIGGVVNFISRKNFEGFEINGEYGRTSRSDGPHQSFNLLFGTSSDKLSFMVGGNYNKQDAVFAGNRDFSKFAVYLYGGSYGAYNSGSSRTPTGRISVPGVIPRSQGGGFVPGSLAEHYGCGSVTRIDSAPGSTLADYRCFNAGFGTGSDRFNYQPFNLLITAQERAGAFSKVNYQVNDYVDIYASVIFNRTHSSNEQAPLPFDSPVDDVVISKNSMYNPFGIDFGGLTTGFPAGLWRLVGLTDRVLDATSTSSVLNGGVKGKLMDTGWEWDLNIGNSRMDQLGDQGGYFFKSQMQNAVGPSFVDGNGVPTCGTVALPIPNCTPLDIFNLYLPGQQQILDSISGRYNLKNTYRFKTVGLDVTGKIATLPAGDLQTNIGIEYASQEGEFRADSIVQAQPPLYLVCQLSNETCTGNTKGKYNSKQIYLELFVPLLKDLPGVKSLNLDIGTRYSDYSLFGNATKTDVKLEYRPFTDLLVRATRSQVFRVPTISDLFSSPANDSVTFNDPCQNLTAAGLAANPNLALACQGVIPDSNFREPNGQITGVKTYNPTLKPETGNVTTFGLVYDPRWAANLSIDIDYWKYDISNLITNLDPNYTIQQCVATGAPEFCGLVTRYQSGAQQGQILVFLEPTSNLSALKTDGIDFGVHYALRDTKVGSFNFGLDVTHTNSYLNTPAPGSVPQEIVGTYNKQFGNYAKNRALGSVGWTFKGFDGLLTARYIGKVTIENPSVLGLDANGNPYPPLPFGAMTYLDMTLGYSFPSKTKVQLGVRNLTDKQPPLMYQNNVTNANTDVYTYDTLGRQWWVGFNQKF